LPRIISPNGPDVPVTSSISVLYRTLPYLVDQRPRVGLEAKVRLVRRLRLVDARATTRHGHAIAAELVDVEQVGKGPGDARSRCGERHEHQARGQLRVIGRDSVERGALAACLDAH
jgi:hypothetical protein